MKLAIALTAGLLCYFLVGCGSDPTDDLPVITDGFTCLPGVTDCTTEMWKAINGTSSHFEAHGQAAVAARLNEMPFNVKVLDVGGAQAACPKGTPGCTFTGGNGVRMLLEPRPIVSKLEGCENVPMTMVHELGHVSLWFGKQYADPDHEDPEMWGPGGIVSQVLQEGVCK